MVSFTSWLLYPPYALKRTLGSNLRLSNFPDIVYIKICTFWTGFIPRTLSVKSPVPYKFIISLL
jgi:hypothetical protein